MGRSGHWTVPFALNPGRRLVSIAVHVNSVSRGIFLTGSSIIGTAIKMPRIVAKNLVSVIFCEAVAIYGLIMAIIMQGRAQKGTMTPWANLYTYQEAEFSGFCYLFVGLIVGISNMACGLSVGVVGSVTA